MANRIRCLTVGTALGLSLSIVAHADIYADTISVFKNAGKSASFFEHSYAYAVFPTIGDGGSVIGAVHGDGHVYVHARLQGDTAMSQVGVGFLAGGAAFSQVIFFQDKRALEEFESGHFQFGADASVVAVTAGASGSAATTGAYHKGTIVFTLAKGGAMFDVSVDGQKFSARQHNLWVTAGLW